MKPFLSWFNIFKHLKLFITIITYIWLKNLGKIFSAVTHLQIFEPDFVTANVVNRVDLQTITYLSAAGFGAELLGVFANGMVQSYLVARTLEPCGMTFSVHSAEWMISNMCTLKNNLFTFSFDSFHGLLLWAALLSCCLWLMILIVLRRKKHLLLVSKTPLLFLLLSFNCRYCILSEILLLSMVESCVF